MKHRFILLKFIIILFVLIIPVEAYSQDYLDLFTKAKELYVRGITLNTINQNPEIVNQLFEESASIYNRIIKEANYKNAYLYYNLGNCYYQLEEIGEAIYNYKIASQLNPSFIDIKKNLIDARSLVKGYIEDKSHDSFLKVLFFWHFQLNAQTRLWIAVISFILLWITAIIGLFIRKNYTKVIIIILAIVATAFILSISVQYMTEQNQWWGVVISKGGIDAKKGPDDNYESSFKQKLSEGIEFNVLQKENNWLKVKLANNEICWLPIDSAKTLQKSILFK